jgi:hypothetical protein
MVARVAEQVNDAESVQIGAMPGFCTTFAPFFAQWMARSRRFGFSPNQLAKLALAQGQ